MNLNQDEIFEISDKESKSFIIKLLMQIQWKGENQHKLKATIQDIHENFFKEIDIFKEKTTRTYGKESYIQESTKCSWNF